MSNSQNKGRKKSTKKPSNRKQFKSKEDYKSYATNGEYKSKTDNDMSWYTPTDMLVRDTSTFTFYNRVGDPTFFNLSKWGSEGTSTSTIPCKFISPGIMSFNFVPTLGTIYKSTSSFGFDGHVNDPINVAGRLLSTKLRLKNTGAVQYSSGDLMRYVMAVGSAIMIYAWLVRIYGLTRHYSSQNSYYPTALLSACGCKFAADAKAHPTYLRTIINQMVLQINTLIVPKAYPIIDRWIWLCSKVLKDDMDIKSQLYVFNPKYYYKWVDYSTSTGDGLTKDNTIFECTSLDSLESAINTLMTDLLSNVSVATINGDILKAYSGDVWNLSEVSELTTCVPEYMPDIMMELQNLSITNATIGNIKMDTTGNLYQTGLAVRASTPANMYFHDVFINMTKEDVMPQDLVYATRFVTAATSNDIVCGTEIVTSLDVYEDPTSVLTYYANVLAPGTSTEGGTASVAATFSQFKMAPLYFVVQPIGDGTDYRVVPCGDINNYTVISKDDLKKIHRVALFGEFGITDRV